MNFDHLDLSALWVTYVFFHHTPHFLMHHLKPCISFLEEKVFSILTTLIISFAKAAFHHIPSYKMLSGAFPWKISCCYCCLPACRVSLLFERVKLISHLFPSQALLLLCRPLAINCLHSSLLTTLPSYLFSCKMLGLIGEKMVKKNPSTSSSLRKLNRVPSNLKAEIRQDLKTYFQLVSYEASKPTYIFIVTLERSMIKSFTCKKAIILI